MFLKRLFDIYDQLPCYSVLLKLKSKLPTTSNKCYLLHIVTMGVTWKFIEWANIYKFYITYF